MPMLSGGDFDAGSMKDNKRTLIIAGVTVASVALIAFGAYRLLAQDRGSAPADLHFEDADWPEALMVVTDPSVPAQIKEYEGFIVSFNKDNKTPNWVAWELLGTETEGEGTRTNKFWTDEEVEGCADTRDYRGTGFDRGHMMPAAEQKWSPEAMHDCFSLANICPQDHSLNSGAWNTLENKERAWARRDSMLLIAAGPIYEATDTMHIGKNRVRVPSAFFKVLAAPKANPPRGIGFIYPNMSAPGSMRVYAMPIREVEKATGLDFFSALPDSLENLIETSTSFSEWDKQGKAHRTKNQNKTAN